MFWTYLEGPEFTRTLLGIVSLLYSGPQGTRVLQLSPYGDYSRDRAFQPRLRFWRRYFPVKTDFRFSWNARIPSR